MHAWYTRLFYKSHKQYLKLITLFTKCTHWDLLEWKEVLTNIITLGNNSYFKSVYEVVLMIEWGSIHLFHFDILYKLWVIWDAIYGEFLNLEPRSVIRNKIWTVRTSLLSFTEQIHHIHIQYVQLQGKQVKLGSNLMFIEI